MTLEKRLKLNKKYSLALILFLSLIIIGFTIRHILNNYVLKSGVCTTSIPKNCIDTSIGVTNVLVISILLTIIFYFLYSYFEYKKSKK